MPLQAQGVLQMCLCKPKSVLKQLECSSRSVSKPFFSTEPTEFYTVHKESSVRGQAPEEGTGRLVQRSQLRLAHPNGIQFV